MIVEDRAHKSLDLNPRRHPRGASYPDKSQKHVAKYMWDVALLSNSEMHFIQDVPRLLGGGDYANLGHAKGGSAILLADGFRENNLTGKIYSVDLFPRNKLLRIATQELARFKVTQWIELCSGNTDEWAFKLQDKQFTFLFIDADHTYQAVKRDFENWNSLVKPGGCVSFHDTNQEFSHRAIEETVALMWPELKEYHIDRIRTFQKPL